MKQDHESQIASMNNKLMEYEGVINNKDSKLRELVVDGMIREAYTSLDFEPSAMNDMIRNGREIFQMGEDGRVTPRDQHGNVIFGKDGKQIENNICVVSLKVEVPSPIVVLVQTLTK